MLDDRVNYVDMYLRIYSLSLAANQIHPETDSFRTVRFHEDDILPSFL